MRLAAVGGPPSDLAVPPRLDFRPVTVDTAGSFAAADVDDETSPYVGTLCQLAAADSILADRCRRRVDA